MEEAPETMDTSDPEVVSAIDNRELRGLVFKHMPTFTTMARVLVKDMDKWLAARATSSSDSAP